MSRLSVFCCGLLAVSCVLADDAPSWLHELASRSVPAYTARVPAVVLLQDTRATVGSDGGVVMTVRKVVKVLSNLGCPEASSSQVYMAGTSRIRDLRGWVITPSGKGIKLGKETIYDRMHSTDSNDLYMDVRGSRARSDLCVSSGCGRRLWR